MPFDWSKMSKYDYDIPSIPDVVILDDISSILYTCCYYARSHHKKRINKKWHRHYGTEQFGYMEERYFKNHNKKYTTIKKDQNNEQDIPSDLICGNCSYYNKDKEIHSEVLGIIHTCDKGYICNSWNIIDMCKDFCLDLEEVYKNVNT